MCSLGIYKTGSGRSPAATRLLNLVQHCLVRNIFLSVLLPCGSKLQQCFQALELILLMCLLFDRRDSTSQHFPITILPMRWPKWVHFFSANTMGISLSLVLLWVIRLFFFDAL